MMLVMDATEKQLAALARQIVRANRRLRREYGAHVAERAIRLGAVHIEAMRQAARATRTAA
jgi:hypothetical protein